MSCSYTYRITMAGTGSAEAESPLPTAAVGEVGVKNVRSSLTFFPIQQSIPGHSG